MDSNNKTLNLVHMLFFVIAIICFSVLFLVVLGDNGNPSQEYSLEKVEEYEITKNVNGKSLELTHKQNESYYTFLAKNADGEYDTLSVKFKYAKIVHINEDETEKVVKFKRKFSSLDKIKLLFATNESKHEYKFYIKP